MSKASDSIRENFRKADMERDRGLETPVDVMRYDDIVYGQDKTWQVLDVYRPVLDCSNGLKKLPVIISYHGGGWVYGDKNIYQYYCMDLARRGFAVINFSYRLAPEYKFPAPLEDMNKVVEWMFLNACHFGFDTSHVFGVGDSAGAHGLCLYSAICTNQEYAKQYDFCVPNAFVPTAVALNCGLYQMEVEGHDLTRELMQDFLPKGGTEVELSMINALSFITSEFPPTYIMTANGDFLKSEAGLLANKFVDLEVPFRYAYYGSKDKLLGHVFHCNMRLDEARICNDEECDFFKEYL